MALEVIDNVKHKRTVIEELVVLVQEPESHYVGHFTPASGSAAAITSRIFSFLETSSISIDDIVALVQLLTLVEKVELFIWLK